MDQNRSEKLLIFTLSYQTFSDNGSTSSCEDLQPESWKSQYESNFGNLCEKYIGPWELCDKERIYCDYKKCGEFCKKTCDKC